MNKYLLVAFIAGIVSSPLMAQDLSSVAKDEISVMPTKSKSINAATVSTASAIKEVKGNNPTYILVSASQMKLKGAVSGKSTKADLSKLPQRTQAHIEVTKSTQLAFAQSLWLNFTYGGIQDNITGAASVLDEKINFHSTIISAGASLPVYQYKDWVLNAQLGVGKSFLTYVSERSSLDGNDAENFASAQLNLKSKAFLQKKLRAVLAFNKTFDGGQSSLDLDSQNIRLGLEFGWL
ncbi:MAG: hypothetical protein HOO06_03250 [Bdellovibrionaceae bacterium]|nr:hypothetical protein [Pseudobdellovibrionaceae bacterium]